MKTKIFGLFILFLIATTVAFTGNRTEKFKVKGKCGMCETRIEKAALSVEGVSKADWNLKTNMLQIVFNDTKTDVGKVHIVVAEVGHDTEKQKAKDEVYNKLPDCCKYDRASGEKD